jgi:hypothetical protein
VEPPASPQGSHPPEFVLDADDVILFQIGSGLHLDDLDRDLARIGKPVYRPDGQLDAFILMQDGDLAIAGHFGGAANHDPVLGPVMVLLQ